jgi:nicotinate-nucleotide adenylyltransferase
MISGQRLGILGGTLDPIHVGHVETARAARAALALTRVVILPSHVPPHRTQQPVASPYHRFAMAALAVSGVDGLEASDTELLAPGPSYTADTLDRVLAQGFGAAQIFFIIGADAFAEIETWHRYPDVLDLSHFVVLSRPGYDLSVLPARLPRLADRMTIPGTEPPRGAGTRIFLLNASTPDVSSTAVRERLRAGQPITGLVPADVERHILKHRLYTGADQSPCVHHTADHLHGQI